MYEEYDPEYLDCLSEGCDGSVVIDKQSTLHFMHMNPGERPRGNDLCERCQALIDTITIPCANRPMGVEGDHGCVGDGHIHLAQRKRGIAVWYVRSGMHEEPRTEPFCDTCLTSVVYSRRCRNVGCRGDGVVRQTGKQKMDTVFVATKNGDPYTPPTQCTPCKDFLDGCVDQAIRCEACQRTFAFTAAHQRALVAREPRSAFLPPRRCRGCEGLGDEELARRGRSARERHARKQARQKWAHLLRESNRARLGDLRRETFEAALMTFARMPTPDAVEAGYRANVLERVSASGREDAVAGLATALEVTGDNTSKMVRALANRSFTEHQVAELAVAFGRLSTGDGYPPRLFDVGQNLWGQAEKSAMSGIYSTHPHIAQAAGFEVYAASRITDNPEFPVRFAKGDISSFEKRQGVDPDFFGKSASFEADLHVSPRDMFGVPQDVLIDFKHSTTGHPPIDKESVDKMVHALTHGHVTDAIIVVNCDLTHANAILLSNANAEIDRANEEIGGGKISHIQTFKVEW